MARKPQKARRIEVCSGAADITCVSAEDFEASVEACSSALEAFKRIDPTLAFKDWEEGPTGYSIERALADAARRCRVVSEREQDGSSRRTARLSVFRAGQEDLQCIPLVAYEKTLKACAAAAKILGRLDPQFSFKDWADSNGTSIERKLAAAARKCKDITDAEAT
ncbi:hypothetical protein ACNFIA_16870 [Pseudomonas sp. NY15437]|uniref:hypothetical protein n=1 Tax=Pseudomonas sp. NY15437 TaxID=3400360 RepID=UPI003A8B5C94